MSNSTSMVTLDRSENQPITLKIHDPKAKKPKEKKSNRYGRRIERATQRSHGRCVYCGIRKPQMNLDHVVPRSQGGGQFENIVAACHSCNASKGGMTPEAWALSILQYQHRLQNGRPSRLAGFLLDNLTTLPRLAFKINTVILQFVLWYFLSKGGAK